MEGRLFLVAAAVVLGCSVALPVRAYDDRTTHPALTSEMVTLYNRLYTDKKVSDVERALMLRGSTEEDITPRPLNHLYDPVHHVGWIGAKTGWVPSVLTRLASLVALLPDKPLASIEWIGADSVQEAYGRYGGNRSWPAGLRSLVKGDAESAYLSLGSSLHLLEDSGVPDHARDDTHVHQIDFLTGDSGSPFEAYASRFIPGSLAIATNPKMTLASIPRYTNPAAYLEDNAQYSANSFFSKDTVSDASFPKPLVTREQGGIAFGKALDGTEVQLARRVNHLGVFTGETTSLELSTGGAFDSIHENNFNVIANRTVALGVGMIRDFKEAQANVAESPVADAQVWSLVGEVDRLLGSVSAQISRAYAWLRGTSNEVEAQNQTVVPPPSAATGTPLEITIGGSVTKKSSKAAVKKTGTAKTPSKSGLAKTTVPDAAKAASVCPPSGAPSVLISEIAWMGTSKSSTDEWIEIENRGDTSASLEGWELSSSDGGIYIDLDGVTIAAHGFALVERTDDGTVPGVKAKAIYVGSLPNAPGAGYSITLQSPSCGIADTVDVQSKWPAGDAASRRTMERKPNGGWQTSAVPGGTPGKQNSGGLQVVSTTTHESAKADEDTASNDAVAPAAPVPFVVDGGTVLISEIQAAGADAGDEFVELYNTESRDVFLKGWSLQYVPNSVTGLSTPQKRDLPEVAIKSHGYYLIGRETNSGGADGYRGATTTDVAHRTFTLSGLGAGLALVRSQDKIVSTSSPDIADWVSYPKLAAYESYERAAVISGICVDSRPGAPGEFAGNGCSADEWYKRQLADPQNSHSAVEPHETTSETDTTSTVSTSSDEIQDAWLSVHTDGYVTDRTVQDWRAMVLVQGSGTPPVELTTGNQLTPVGVSTVQLAYRACNGADIVTPVLVLPMTPVSCQNGGPLSGALARAYWEDTSLLVKIASHIVGDAPLRILEYGFAGGRAGEQHFALTGVIEGPQIMYRGTGIKPNTPTGIFVDDTNLSAVKVSWNSVSDPDSLDEDLRYEISVTPIGQEIIWESADKNNFVIKALQPGEYAVAVRAIDEQDNQSESGTLGFVISPPKNSEYFEHSDALGPGSGSLVITSSTVLSGIGVWMNPDGGRFCCSQAIVNVISQAGNVLAHGRGGRRQVDGPGDTTIMFESPIVLVAGTYTLQIEYLDSVSNGYQIYGTGSGGDWNGLGKIYLRLIEDK